MAGNLKDLISFGEKFIGVPYVYGGTTPKGFDCSGYTKYVWGHYGVKLPRTSQDQARAGIAVSKHELSPGDLILSDWGEGPNSHVALYAGNGMLLEAPRTGQTVHAIHFTKGYEAHVNGYRRVGSKKKGLLDTITAITGGALGDVVGSVENAAGGLFSFPSQITGFFSTAADDLTSVTEFFAAFFRPSTYVRIGAGLMGAVFVAAACVFLLMDARNNA